MHVNRLTEQELDRVHAWRKRVVRLWLATMGAAILVWAASAGFRLSEPIQIALFLGLTALVIIATVAMRRGRCPRCGQAIRFAPRIELPPACSRCQVPFHST